MSSPSRRSLPRSPLALLVLAAISGCNDPPPADTPDACTSCEVDAAPEMDAGGDAGADANLPDSWSIPDVGVPVDDHWSERAACSFAAGADPDDTLEDLAGARAAIDHVIILMQENRSLDHMFGRTGHGIEGFPDGFSAPNRTGTPVEAYHATTSCLTPDPPHQWANIHGEWNNGAMDGFVRVGGNVTMAYYEDADHPFYSWMLTTFATSDRYFCDVLSGTWPNRDYLYAGTSAGVMSTGQIGRPPPSHTIFDELDTRHITWGDYAAPNAFNECLEGSLGGTLTPPSGFCARPQVHPYSELAAVLAGPAADIPSVIFIDLEPEDEHPPGDLHVGETAVHDVLAQVFASAIWPHTAFFYTYDENGGFFDHVAPPGACLADPTQTMFDRLGMRVPVAVVSPFARPGYVSHLTHSHASILRFVEAVFDIPAMTGRDANSDAMLDFFDFSTATFATPPTPVAAATPDPSCP
ncbi:MAG: alkaline phosphatase family protein [Sandaracinus sp.]